MRDRNPTSRFVGTATGPVMRGAHGLKWPAATVVVRRPRARLSGRVSSRYVAACSGSAPPSSRISAARRCMRMPLVAVDYNYDMYDVLTTRYTFACPARGKTSVRLSAFREVDRLPGAAHPAAFRVRFACGCGEDHVGLVAHDDLDWAPLGLDDGATFLNLMTARVEPLDSEFVDLAIRRIQAGEWPWSFFCYPEERPRPIFPSSFFLLAPAEGGGGVGIAVRCPACSSVSVNLVSPQHVDLPFHNDSEIGVVEHVFSADTAHMVEQFAAELDSALFDARRLALE